MLTLFWTLQPRPIRTSGLTTTFCPRLHFSPILLPGMMCVKCQIDVPAPILQPSSTTAVGWILTPGKRVSVMLMCW